MPNAYQQRQEAALQKRREHTKQDTAARVMERENNMREYARLFYALHGRELTLRHAGAWIHGAGSKVTTPIKLIGMIADLRKQLLLRDAAQHELDMRGEGDLD